MMKETITSGITLVQSCAMFDEDFKTLRIVQKVKDRWPSILILRVNFKLGPILIAKQCGGLSPSLCPARQPCIVQGNLLVLLSNIPISPGVQE